MKTDKTMKCRMRWPQQGKGTAFDRVLNGLIHQAGIAMPRWAFIQHYLDRGMSFALVERMAMAKDTLAPAAACQLESFESAVDRGWFIVPIWAKVEG